MMDPITALSLAGTVVQFVDFATKIVSKGWRLHKFTDGILLENYQLEVTTKDLLALNQRLKGSLMATGTGLAGNDQALEAVCNRCISVGEQLLERLNSLKALGSFKAWKSFRNALKIVCGKDELDAMRENLNMARKGLELRILISLKSNVDLLAIRESDYFENLGQHTQHIVLCLSENRTAFQTEIQEQTKAISKMHHQTEEVISEQHDQTRSIILDALARERRQKEMKQRRAMSPFANLYLDDTLDDRRQRCIERLLIDGLQYATMFHRYETVAQAYQDTFNWIYQHPQVETRPWTNFAQWLRHGNGIYWINGKAASGKSTLMRYIYDDPRTREKLLAWSGMTKLQIAGFFFWNSGTLEQKSQTGLLRSLLFETLRQRKELIPVVMPHQWSRLQSLALESLNELPPCSWSLPELEGAFRALVEQQHVPLKLCLFIDGLDEYSGDHAEVVRLFKKVAASRSLKVCLSSRPLVIFENAFGKLPGLRLQDLTFSDIQHFVTEELSNNSYMKELLRDEPESAPQLTGEIVTKAQGVFLWVSLVVRSLLAGLQNGDRISGLQKRVRLLPPDLEHLYSHMLTRIDPIYHEQASQLFQLVRAAREQTENGLQEGESLTILMLSFADNEDPDEAIQAPIKPLSSDRIISPCEAMERRVKSKCRGMLEVHEYSDIGYDASKMVVSKSEARVVYLHRTVKDYLEGPVIWNDLVKRTAKSGFDANIALLRACLLRLKYTATDDAGRLLATSQSLVRQITLNALYYASKCLDLRGETYFALLDELDRTVGELLADVSNARGVDHWTACLMAGKQSPWKDENFLTITIEFGLLPYVRQHLDQNCEVINNRTGRPLLYYAIFTPTTFSEDTCGCSARDDMILLLLQRGADPNAAFVEITIWHHVLLRVRGGGQRKLSTKESQAWAKVFRALIQHRADPNAAIRISLTNEETRTALFVVKEAFRPRERDQLEILLLESGAKRELSDPEKYASSHASNPDFKSRRATGRGKDVPEIKFSSMFLQKLLSLFCCIQV